MNCLDDLVEVFVSTGVGDVLVSALLRSEACPRGLLPAQTWQPATDLTTLDPEMFVQPVAPLIGERLAIHEDQRGRAT